MKKEWIRIVKRKRNPFFIYIIFEGFSKQYIKIPGLDYRYKGGCIYLDDEYFLETIGSKDLENRILARLSKNKSFLLDVTKQAYKEFDKYMKFWKKISNMNLSRLSDKELTGLFEDYVLTLLKWNAYLHLPNIAEGIITRRLEIKLKKLVKDKDKFRKYFILFTTPVKKSSVWEENMSLWEIVRQIQKNKVDPRKLVERHLKDFAWITNVTFLNVFMDFDDIMKRIKEMKHIDAETRIKEIKAEEKKYRNEYQKAIKELKPGKELLALIKTAQEFVFFRSFRMEVNYRSAYYVQNLFAETAKRLGINPIDLLYLIPPEIIDALKSGKKIDKIIAERKKSYGFSNEGGRINIYSGKQLRDFRKTHEIKSRKELIEDITGSCASPGVAEGIVRIVPTGMDIAKIKQGDILVTSMTTPDFVPAMKRAAAIITDEGGITCHAAVVSRELGIPCVIGTKQATEILKDRDLVRVDASHGLVRIIKRA